MFPDYAGQVAYAEAAQGPHQSQLKASIEAGESILYETTGSRPDVLDIMKSLKEHDYRVTLIRIDLESETLSKLRISQRAKTGGSNVAADRVSARWPRGIENFVKLAAQADETYIYDNSSKQMALTAQINGQTLDVMIADKLPHIIEALRAESFKEKPLTRIERSNISEDNEVTDPFIQTLTLSDVNRLLAVDRRLHLNAQREAFNDVGEGFLRSVVNVFWSGHLLGLFGAATAVGDELVRQDARHRLVNETLQTLNTKNADQLLKAVAFSAEEKNELVQKGQQRSKTQAFFQGFGRNLADFTGIGAIVNGVGQKIHNDWQAIGDERTVVNTQTLFVDKATPLLRRTSLEQRQHAEAAVRNVA
jgi:predicted ABC-type ATPase